MKQKSSNKRESWNLFSKNSSFKQSRTSLWKTWPGSSPFRKRFWTKERSLLLGTEGITLQNTSPVIWYSFLVSIGRHSPDGCGVTVPTPCILGSARIPRQPNVVQSHGWWIMVFPVHPELSLKHLHSWPTPTEFKFGYKRDGGLFQKFLKSRSLSHLFLSISGNEMHGVSKTTICPEKPKPFESLSSGLFFPTLKLAKSKNLWFPWL